MKIAYPSPLALGQKIIRKLFDKESEEKLDKRDWKINEALKVGSFLKFNGMPCTFNSIKNNSQ